MRLVGVVLWGVGAANATQITLTQRVEADPIPYTYAVCNAPFSGCVNEGSPIVGTTLPIATFEDIQIPRNAKIKSAELFFNLVDGFQLERTEELVILCELPCDPVLVYNVAVIPQYGALFRVGPFPSEVQYFTAGIGTRVVGPEHADKFISMIRSGLPFTAEIDIARMIEMRLEGIVQDAGLRTKLMGDFRPVVEWSLYLEYDLVPAPEPSTFWLSALFMAVVVLAGSASRRPYTRTSNPRS